MQNYVVKEQIRKRVVRSGNSGAVWVPKHWLGEDIVVTRLETPKLSLAEELLHLLLPHLKDISGIFLYGSYARNEETQNSDIDVLVIAKSKFTLRHTKRFDLTVIEASKIQEAVQKNPFVYAIIHEAKPLMNSSLLEELQHYPTDFKHFIRWFKETTADSMKSTKELLDLDKLTSNYLTSYSTIYSLLLRLKGVFLIKSTLLHRAFSNALFKKFVTHFISASEFAKILKIYRNVRDNKNIQDINIEVTLAYKLLALLQKEVKHLHAQ